MWSFDFLLLWKRGLFLMNSVLYVVDLLFEELYLFLKFLNHFRILGFFFVFSFE